MEVLERETQGGEWVKRPTGAKGFERRMKCLKVAEAPCALATVCEDEIVAGGDPELVVVTQRFAEPSNVLFLGFMK